jgi:tRNA threonylcarbamoyladenosine biosynthesis protein TsaB
MLILALDTADARGSVAVLRDDAVVATLRHDGGEDYSSWLLPAVNKLAAVAGIGMADVDLYAVSAGPGSFTGLRVGLTAVKAWSEIHQRPIAAVSRLEAIATHVAEPKAWVAAFFDAHRKQIFGGLYRHQREGGGLELAGEEMVIRPEGFLAWVRERTQGAEVSWASLDPHLVRGDAGWSEFAAKGGAIAEVTPELAPTIGKIGLRMAQENRLTDALRLDANYVRRSDAELLWKGPAAPKLEPAHGTHGK